MIIKDNLGISDDPGNSLVCRINPNPGDGNIRIVFNDFLEMVRITVINSLGQTVKSPVDFKAVQAREEICLSFDDLMDGIYFIEFCNAKDEMFSLKCILRH